MNRIIAFLIVLSVIRLFAEPTFTTQPTLNKIGEGNWQINFELSENTDVEVAIVSTEDSSVVCHLAAGKLGANAVSPLIPNTLNQQISWNGRDDFNKPVALADNLLAVRVRAGMSVALDTLLGANPYGISGAVSIALDGNGSVVAFGSFGPHFNSSGMYTLRQFGTDGEYKKTIYPFPKTADRSKIAPFGVVALDGTGFQLETREAPFPTLGNADCMLSTGGCLLPFMYDSSFLMINQISFNFIKISAKGDAVSSPLPLITTPSLFRVNPEVGPVIGGPINVTLMPNSDIALLSAFYQCNNLTTPADTGFWRDGQVFKLNLKTGAISSWLSVDASELPKSAAERQALLGPLYMGHETQPQRVAVFHGTAVDDSGHVFVCDRLHGRIGIYDSTAHLIDSIPVASPYLVSVNSRTGEVYVLTWQIMQFASGMVAIKKFSDWHESPTQVANVVVTTALGFSSAAWNARVCMGADFSGAKPVFWVAGESGIRSFQDEGTSFTLLTDLSAKQPKTLVNFDRVSIDRKRETLYMQDSYCGMFKVENWLNPLFTPCSTSAGQRVWSTDMATSPDGQYLFVRRAIDGYTNNCFDGPIDRYTLGHYNNPAMAGTRGTNQVTDILTQRWGAGNAERGFAVTYDNSAIAAIHRINQVSGAQHGVQVWDTNKVALKYWMTSLPDKTGGLQLDKAGNLYVGARAWGANHAVPAGYESDPGYLRRVGAVIRVAPDSVGMVQCSDGTASQVAINGASRVYSQGLAPYSLEGSCCCRSPRFYVDPYGRIFMPNAVTGRVNIVDNNDNLLLRFGEYGNIDSKGPGIPFIWPVGVAASENHIYVTDMVNEQLVRVRMNYALDNMPGFGGNTGVADAAVGAFRGAPLRITATPNPFNTMSRVNITLPANTDARLDVYDAAGRLVKTLIKGRMASGMHALSWNGRDGAGRTVSAGMYAYRLYADNRVLTTRTLFTR